MTDSCAICGGPARVEVGATDYCAEHAADGVEFHLRLHALAFPPPEGYDLEATIAEARATVRFVVSEGEP